MRVRRDGRRRPPRPRNPAGAFDAVRLADHPAGFVGGELVGGADIVQELAESGELTGILEAKLGAGYRDEAAERVVDVLTPAQR